MNSKFYILISLNKRNDFDGMYIHPLPTPHLKNKFWVFQKVECRETVFFLSLLIIVSKNFNSSIKAGECKLQI